jgi:hypothetical protein
MVSRALQEMEDGSSGSIAGSSSAQLSHHAAEVVRAAQQELDTLLRQRSEIVKRIGAVKQTLVGLTSIFDCSAQGISLTVNGFTEVSGAHLTGLTNACRMALLQARTPLRPHQVRDRLRFQGLSLENHRDPVATVTTVLRRLGQYGEARAVIQPDGKRAWEWVGSDDDTTST